MKYFSEISIIFTILISALTVQSSPLNIRAKRSWFRTATSTTKATTEKPLPPLNNLDIGECAEDDKLIYIDDTRIESNNSTLGGVIEIYIDSPYIITCCKVFDQLLPGTGAFPTFKNITESGGPGYKFIKIDVQGRLHYGIHFKVFVYGTLPIKSESNHL